MVLPLPPWPMTYRTLTLDLSTDPPHAVRRLRRPTGPHPAPSAGGSSAGDSRGEVVTAATPWGPEATRGGHWERVSQRYRTTTFPAATRGTAKNRPHSP